MQQQTIFRRKERAKEGVGFRELGLLEKWKHLKITGVN